MIKPFLLYEEQIEKLRSHGCLIEDVRFARQILSQTNYYRLSAYFLPFKQADGNYRPGTDFAQISRIYEFDRKMRSILFTAIARIEVLLRSQLAYHHAKRYGPTGYLHPDGFRHNGHNHGHFINQINEAIKKNAKVLFVQHHIQNYNSQFPLWVIVELFTFGMLSRFYADLTTQDQKNIAKDSFKVNHKTLISWLRCCTDLRNNCAHHGRLYFRIFPAAPAGFENANEKDKRRLFYIILILKKLYPDKSVWNKEVFDPLQQLIDEYSKDILLHHIGFPADWQDKLKIDVM